MFFKNTIEALGRTPLVELTRLSPKKSVHIYAKLEGQNAGGSASIKDRIAKYMVEKAEQEGKLGKGKTIIEATSGNTGIALAWLGRQKGYRVVIVMPDNMSPERRRLIELFGAELILTDGALGVNHSIDVAREMAAKDNRFFWVDQFSNEANPLAHYETTGKEILDDFPGDRIDVLVAGLGTGGTIVGVTRRLKEKFPKLRVVGVEPPPGDTIQGLRCMAQFVPPVLDLSLLDERSITTSKEAEEGARLLLKKEGIFAGVSSGAAVYRSIEIARHMERGSIITILADGGWKYLSMDFWQNKGSE
jgi:cysteine synthase B